MSLDKSLVLVIVSLCVISGYIKCLDKEDPLIQKEGYMQKELEEKEAEFHSLEGAQADYFTRESFFYEYDKATSKYPEVVTAKKFLPTRTTTIDKDRYKSLLKTYMDGTVHDQEIDEDIREEAHKQLEIFVENYVDDVAADKNDFTIEDLYTDYIAGKFHEWLDKSHPEIDHEIEPEL